MTKSTKEENLSIKIPKLVERNTFLEWKNIVISFLSTKQLAYLINYDAQRPILLHAEPLNDETAVDQVCAVLVPLLTGLTREEVKRYPLDFRNQIRSAPRSDIQAYQLESTDLPDDLVHLSIDATLVVIYDQLFCIYESREKYVKARAALIKDKAKVTTIIRSSIVRENQHFFDTAQTEYFGFKQLC